jgi:hypothetical protein
MDGLHVCESNRRLGREEGYGGIWPVLLLGTRKAWWLSLAPGLLVGLRDIICSMSADGMSGHAITDRLRSDLTMANMNNARWQSSFLFVPREVPPQRLLPPDGFVRCITAAEKPVNVPEESVAAGTAMGLFVDGILTSWAEATPLTAVTERFGVMLVGIETQERFQRRGFASIVLAELTRRVLAMGNVPLYSCAQNNVASQHTAISCGYIRYGECFRLQVTAST